MLGITLNFVNLIFKYITLKWDICTIYVFSKNAGISYPRYYENIIGDDDDGHEEARARLL